MKGIELFLVKTENNKICCKLMEEEIEYNEHQIYDVMYTANNKQIGISLCGKLEDKEDIKNELINFYKKEIRESRKELDQAEQALNKLLKSN